MAMQMKRRSWIAVGAVVVVATVGIVVWRTLAPREETDDAQIAGHVSPVSARVSGAVTAVPVADNQPVKAGEVLVQIDPRDAELAVARAEADLASAEASAHAAESDVPVASATATSGQHIAEAGTGSAEAGLRAAERDVDASRAKLGSARARLTEATANATRASQDLKRLEPLAAKDEVPRQQFDAVTAAAAVARATVESAEAAVGEAQANLEASEARRAQMGESLSQAREQSRAAATAPQRIALIQARAAAARAVVLQARAALDQARVTLERTTVRAPAAGLVSRKSVEVGQVIQPGQLLLSLATLDDIWVVANFKETQLSGMKPGQRAQVTVDAFDGRTFDGRIDSISAATGALFSLLPPDNATGNFVKVVQRVPVKILLDPSEHPETVLRPGMSVSATVFLR
jgi:membrane fusion protein (multidrug efflux system)